MSDFGQHLKATADSVRTGPIGEMRAQTKLTANDLRRGAERLEREAAKRRAIADRIQDRVVTAAWVAEQMRHG